MFITPRVVESELDLKNVVEDLRDAWKDGRYVRCLQEDPRPGSARNQMKTLGYIGYPSPHGDKKTSPNPDKFLLQQSNGNLRQSISVETPLTMPGPFG